MINSPEMFEAFVELSDPVKPPVAAGAVQLYNVPVGTVPFAPFVGVTIKGRPLHITSVKALIAATGSTTIVNVNKAPLHAPDKGVIQ